MKRPITALFAAGALLLAGCGTEPGGGPAREGVTPEGSVPFARASGTTGDDTFNATDVMFLQMMVEQHAAAARMLRLAADRATTPELRTLAAAIEVTQQTETETMTGWLRDWGQPLTVHQEAHQAHDAHGGHDVLRGTTEADLDLLESAGGADFERTFLSILIAHQHNAVELARMESSGGVHPEVRELAHRIDRSRTGQIQQMLTMTSRSGQRHGEHAGHDQDRAPEPVDIEPGPP